MKILFFLFFLLFNDDLKIQEEFNRIMKENPRKALRIPCILPTTQIDGTTISSLYGLRKHPLCGGLKHHKGIDIAVKNAKVIATASGIVKEARWSESYGYFVEIDHLNGFRTLYGHLSTIFVVPNQHVEITAVLGVSGSTGNTTGEHIHYEVRRNEEYLNPLHYILLLYDSLRS